MNRPIPKHLLPMLLVLSWCVVACLAVAAEPAYEVEVRENTKIPMSDGVELAAHIFLPKADGKYPVILVRTPYGKGGTKGGAGHAYASRGYVYISQDCRGKGASDGEWTPFINEPRDGKDTHQWILEQPWCNGTIGTAGGSYVGFTQWTSAPNAGEYLKAMFPVVPLVDPYGDVAYVGGAYQMALMMGWGAGVSGNPNVRTWDHGKWNEAFRALPLCTWDEAIGGKVQYLRDWVAHPHFDEYWERCSLRGKTKDITTPMYVVCGWYDLFSKSVLDHVNSVKQNSRSESARQHLHILMGPWTHGISRDGKVGSLDFGKESVVNVSALQAEWFGHWLKGEEVDADKWPPLRIFVMGKNVWRDEEQWPLQRTRYTPYYFHSQGAANTLEGDGSLNTTKPDAEPEDQYVYDPEDPVPTLGGNNLGRVPVGPHDQTKAEQRADVLVYTSDALTSELEVTGPVQAVVYATSTATDTDWTAKLVDVYPDGRAINLCDGIIRARYRESADEPMLIEPGKVYCYEIDLWVTSNVFLPGHKIRVEISSSNFPRFDRNPNTGHPFGADAELQKATQTIHHTLQHPSHIILPVIPRS